MEKEFIDLFEFQTKLKEGVESLFPKRLWLRAEISAIKARNGGHCYLELSQSNENGLIAKVGAVIWNSRFRFIAPYFESVTGTPLQEGMSILVEVQPSYSQLYGFSLVINDIDPEFSLGIRELERQKTIERLQSEGLMELQKELMLPYLPYRFAVISAEDAAGYRDFVKHIAENPYHFKVELDLFPALMQGKECPESIVAAMDRVLAAEIEYDAVLILRGGGSKLDLACFDDYNLAAVIAQYPIPVLTAVGHDQDFHVCDMVAHEYVKTPTAMADLILEIYEDEDSRLSSYASRMKLAFASRLMAMDACVDALRMRIKGGFALKLANVDSCLDVLQARISAADPRKILEKGYALTVDDKGVVMKGVAGREVGDRVSVLFADGTLDCEVVGIK